MDLPDDLQIIHQPTRLRIMALLSKHRDCSFRRLRDALGLTDGNLGSHTKRLEEAGLVTSRRSLGATGVMVRFTITARGDAAVASYAVWLATDDGTPGPIMTDPAEKGVFKQHRPRQRRV